MTVHTKQEKEAHLSHGSKVFSNARELRLISNLKIYVDKFMAKGGELITEAHLKRRTIK